MAFNSGLIEPQVHDALAMRRAGAPLLQLALMDARNRTLGWLSAFDGLSLSGSFDGFDPPHWLAAQAAWYQEYWIARHVQRARGDAADAAAPRLASVLPQADTWFDPQASTRAERWQAGRPDAVVVRQYLADTLDTTLDLLDKAGDDDAALQVFRQALWHEDGVGVALAELVQALDLAPERQQVLVDSGLWPGLPSRGRPSAMAFPGQRWQLGTAAGGFVPPSERWAHEVVVPSFEIDAQVVSWAQFAEFVDDGGYDQRQWWTEAGWDHLEATARRAPRYVEQVSGSVLARRQGRLQRVPSGQPVLHVTAHEAQAWCQWAGRRLPSEAEWELAAVTASARGFVWGEVVEWVAGRARAYPGGPSAGWGGTSVDPGAADGGVGGGVDGSVGGGWPPRLLRGASVWGSGRLRHARARQAATANADEHFVGFRSCAV